MDWPTVIRIALLGLIPFVWFTYSEISSIERHQKRSADALDKIAKTLMAIDERAAKDQRERESAKR